MNFVYACALRRVGGDVHLAEDVTQQVFATLAREIAKAATRPVLAAWLFTTTRFVAARVVRSERRRQYRESEAQLMQESSDERTDWEQLRPMIDEALDSLAERDREAVLLRYFAGRSYADVGARLRLSENAARMRTERALDKMHGLLSARGLTSTTAALAAAFASQASIAAPASLAAAATSAALMGTASVVGMSALTFFGMTKLQIGVAAAAIAASGVGFFVEGRAVAALRRELASARADGRQGELLRAERARLARTASEAQALQREAQALPELQRQAAALARAAAAER
ncbi:MAG: sigma-70 family RNA polymerase sigma factor, partial [Opitutaceae bacterium]